MDISIIVTIISVSGVIASAVCSIIASAVTASIYNKKDFRLKEIEFTLIRKFDALEKFHSSYGVFFAKPTFLAVQEAGRSVGGLIPFVSIETQKKLFTLLELSNEDNYNFNSVYKQYRECTDALNQEIQMKELALKLKRH